MERLPDQAVVTDCLMVSIVAVLKTKSLHAVLQLIGDSS
jgi:hypothetical protein